ncbi:hypothetical protein EH228_08100 [Erwinia endophytica]|uniref:hypothetical protein n=1 Tax=Erwinia endophytica TaxID=1563158 RepID=UPI001265F119|nr:hypothetical protein [Erwinia endophytica]KAB8312149.1 hypothetical protein EH228_08100 [Erwinia endophytica]
MLATFTLRLTRSVSKFLLPDIRALIPAESIQFFSNELDEEWHYTLLCVRNDNNCSLAVSALLIWRQLKRIHKLVFSTPLLHKDVSNSSPAELFTLLKIPGAVLYLS